MVGLRYGLYKNGCTSIGDCTNLGIAMPAAIPVAKSFTEFIRKSKREPHVQHSGTGHWHTLTVRTYLTVNVLAMVDPQPRLLDEEEIEADQYSLKESYTQGEGQDASITSLYFRVLGGKVNTPATEKLYELIAEWANVSPSTTVLDICCGTGTIGLSLANKVMSVIGIEMSYPAIQDAKANARINGITNAVFHCAKVEDIINKTVNSLSSPQYQDAVALVDPPRAGLHQMFKKM
ncbi:tRNA (uracil-5-)-methyltransferase A [Biomphalaria pfeifferi]|uniref:tRNA (uracil(54)-C(5))-methyltransferase n=1 Tax=Biomphalaria pfeifferi TaxID=112525 RepID=A0AAD8F5V3_BIOPF|nr:tRNA (uracil-5-)-methyltransferase A [Biomphalaria pfeifferi]